MTALGIMPTHVMVYVIPDVVVLDRITGRWIDTKSGRVYHEKYHPPLHSGKDDITGDVLVRRNDDTPEVMQERLAIYHSAVKDILAYYHVLQQRNPLMVCYLNADDSIDGVHHALMSALH
jgi:adenylate kinase